MEKERKEANKGGLLKAVGALGGIVIGGIFGGKAGAVAGAAMGEKVFGK